MSILMGIVLAVVFASLGVAKIARTPSMRARAGHVGFSTESYQLIGAAEVLGAVGVAAGLVYAPVGYVAGAGLLVLLAGAVGAHLRTGDRAADLGPAVLFAAGTAAYLLALAAS